MPRQTQIVSRKSHPPGASSAVEADGEVSKVPAWGHILERRCHRRLLPRSWLGLVTHHRPGQTGIRLHESAHEAMLRNREKYRSSTHVQNAFPTKSCNDDRDSFLSHTHRAKGSFGKSASSISISASRRRNQYENQSVQTPPVHSPKGRSGSGFKWCSYQASAPARCRP